MSSVSIMQRITVTRPASTPCVRCIRTPSLAVSRRATSGARCTIVRAASSDEEYVPEEGFTLSKVSFGTILLPAGVVLMTFGFGAYFQLIPGGGASGIALIYGFPCLLLGLALQYAQLEPVPCVTTRAAYDLRDTQMTDIQKQVRLDCTRFRYGDEQHLDDSLSRIFIIGRPMGVSRRQCPRLQALREEVVDGNYALVLDFENRNGLPQERWEQAQEKFESYFGPGVTATQKFISKDRVEVVLRTDGSGLGMDGVEQPDVLPPLTPNSPARRQ